MERLSVVSSGSLWHDPPHTMTCVCCVCVRATRECA